MNAIFYFHQKIKNIGHTKLWQGIYSQKDRANN